MKRLSLLVLTFLFTLASFAQLTAVNLKVENLTNPLGIDVQKPLLSWQLSSKQNNSAQSAYEIKVMKGKETVWATGKVNSDQSILIPYNGTALQSAASYTWQVRVWDQSGKPGAFSKPASFQMALLSSSDWKASWIEAPFLDSTKRAPQYFRKNFSLSKPVRKATAFITAHGIYEAFINGKRVGDAYLTPGWTSYNKRLQYQQYDVTSLLQTGGNAIGAMIGNGWYRSYLAWENNRDVYGKKVGLICQIQVEYADGSVDYILSDNSWKLSSGAVIMGEIYHGETIDARLEQTGWATASFNDQSWTPVTTASYKDPLIATYNEPIRKHEQFQPIKSFTTPKGERVMDFGQNLVGWVRIVVKGKAGDTVRIKHAEVLDKEGNFYTENLRAAKATATYILKGDGEEIFEPHFTFFGFRYIQVEGPMPTTTTAIALYSDMARTGTFSTSNKLLNQLQHNIQWGQRGNFLDVPTDCPQRDERLGWTGDAQAFSRTAMFNFDVKNFFSKWLKDVAADQLPNGSVPFVVPNVLGPGASGSTGWADVATIIPWNQYLAFGDVRILEDQYASMKAWVSFMEKNSKNDLWNVGFHFGDWLFYRPFDDNDGSSAVTDKYLIAQCFYAHSTQLMINAAKALGKADDLNYYTNLLGRIKAAFMKEYVTPNGRLVSSTQTAYVLALNFDMLPESMRAEAADRLEQNVKRYGDHLTTGFLGTPYLCHVLSRFGKTETAFKLLLQESYPSWLYPVKMGATTIWERWNGIRTDGTFEPASMNSFNHYAYGAIGDWMYRVVAGLDTDPSAPGYKKIIIKPLIGGGLTQVAANLETPYGKASSEWTVSGKQVTLNVSIPVNTTATIYIPASAATDVLQNGAPLKDLNGLSVLGMEGKYLKVSIGSGNYVFNSILP